MRICYLINKEYPQNNATGTNEIPRMLARLGVDVTVIAAKTGRLQPRRELVDGVSVHRIPIDRSSMWSLAPTAFGYRALRRVDALHRIESFDALHLPAFPKIGAIIAPLPWFEVPETVVLDVRGTATSTASANWLSRMIIGLQATLLDTVTILDPLMAADIPGDLSSAHIVPLGADLNRFHPGEATDLRADLGVDPADVMFGYTGSLAASREIERLLTGFARAHKSHPQAKFVVVGDDSGREDLHRRTRELDVANAVIFTGEVPFSDIPEYLHSFDVGIAYVPDKLPYRIQPPLKTVEFLGSGLPVLGTDTPGNQRFIEDGVNGALCRDTVPAYASAIREMVDSPANRTELAERARESVAKYDYERIVRDRLLPIYNSRTEGP